MSKLYFLSGLPRSGTTLLASILAQNPRFHCSATSALISLVGAAAQQYHEAQQTIANSAKGQCAEVIKGIIGGMYRHVEQPVIFDKNRGWPHPNNICLIEESIGVRPKIICPVRPIAEILASYVALMRGNVGLSHMEREMQQRGFPLTDDSRCKYLMGEHGNVRQAWQAMKAAVDGGFSDCLLFLEYNDIISKPHEIVDRVYKFIGVEPFDHDFERIENHAVEDDVAAYGLKNLHTIRPLLARKSPEPRDVLGEKLCRFYQGGEFWNPNKPEPAKEKTVIDLQLEASIRGDFDVGWQFCQLADETDDRAMFNKGWYVLRQGKLRDGVALLNRGRNENVFGNPSPSRMPIYDGRTLHGETVLLNSEGGLGDQICNVRFAKDIAERGGHVVLACDASLAPLLSQVLGVSAVVESAAAGGVYHQYWVPAMGAPSFLNLEYGDLDGAPCLPCVKTNPNERLRVGIRWAGNPEFEHEQHRKFDPTPMFNLQGVDLVSLQRDWEGKIPAHIKQPSLDTWERTATEIAKCDLVISSCTAVAHLSATMGKPTWIIIPILPYYLWALPGETSPWYDSVKLFRQEKYGDWSVPMRRVTESLDKLISQNFEKFDTASGQAKA